MQLKVNVTEISSGTIWVFKKVKYTPKTVADYLVILQTTLFGIKVLQILQGHF